MFDWLFKRKKPDPRIELDDRLDASHICIFEVLLRAKCSGTERAFVQKMVDDYKQLPMRIDGKRNPAKTKLFCEIEMAIQS